MHTEILTFIIALIASLSLTVPVRRLALHYGFVDLPGPRKVHAKPIPLMGGAAIYLGFVLAALLTLHGQPRWQVAGIICRRHAAWWSSVSWTIVACFTIR